MGRCASPSRLVCRRERRGWSSLTLASAAALSPEDVLGRLQSTIGGLSHDESSARLAETGANALRSHGARPLAVLARQLRNPLLMLLVAAALTSFAVGERTSALIILLIVCLSVGLGYFNEYRAELSVEALHSQLRHTALAIRGGEPVAVDVTELVPGDVVRLAVGDVVPADLRLLDAEGLECDEAVLTGESLPAEKRSDPVQAPESPLDLASCAFMGTVVRTSGDSARPTRLGRRPPQTFCKRLSATPQTSGKRSARRKHTPTMTNPRKPLFQAIFGNQFRPQTSS